MAGMLHDIGKVVLISSLTQEYESALKLADEKGINVSRAEVEVIGVDHSAIGGYLLGLWGFADDIVEVSFFHHKPSLSGETSFTIVTAAHVADALVAEEYNNYTKGVVISLETDHIKRIGKAGQIDKWKVLAEKIVTR
jgi:HD-like signal output (HDOD) protein